jgi:uncharacterized membrane protein
MAQSQAGSKMMAAPRWMRVLLGASLALNLLVLGLVSGALVRYGGSDGLRPPPRTVGAALFRELPPEDRRALRDRSDGMMMMNGMNMNHHERRVAEAQAVSAAMRATPFDREALAAILEQQAAQRDGFQKSVQQAWIERVANMTEAERQAYAGRLVHAMNRPTSMARRMGTRDK